MKKVKGGLTDHIDIHLLTDIKRMVNNKTLTIDSSNEVQPLLTHLAAPKQVRIYFTGEDVITEQSKVIEEMATNNSRLEKLVDRLQSEVEALANIQTEIEEIE